MISQTLRACPDLLTEDAKKTLQGMTHSSGVTSDFMYAKKAVVRKAAPEIVSHVSAINLDVAAGISELIVEQTLTELERATLRLVRWISMINCSLAAPPLMEVFLIATPLSWPVQ